MSIDILKEIEDRKIKILLEISSIKNDYNAKISQLRSEYEQLHKKYYHFKLNLIRRKE